MSALNLGDRLAKIETTSLEKGAHNETEGMCVMEAVAYVAGEPWSDAPVCACPVIGAFLRNWNDSLPSNAERDRLLKPLIPKLIETRSTHEVEEKRAYLALDWLVRVHTPMWFDLVADFAPHSKALRDLDEITDMAGAIAAGKITTAARDAARAAALGTARDAARDAALGTARDAARDAARAAALGTARDAAWDAAWDAASDAAWAAARAAAWDAASDAAWAAARAAARGAAGKFLKPTVSKIQDSALELVDRMIAVKS
jgi:hypothetical protein